MVPRGLKIVLDSRPHKLMVEICHQFCWGKSHISYKRLHGGEDILLQGFEGVDIFESHGSVNYKEGIFDAV